MRKLLLLLVAFATVSMSAQVTVFSDDFEAETVDATTYINWTAADQDADGNNWEVADFAAYAAGGPTALPINTLAADSDSWEGSAFNPNNFLITTNQIDLTNASGTIELKFLVGTYQTNGTFIADQYSIYLTASNDPATIQADTPIYNGTVGDLMLADQPDGSASAVLQTIDISAYAGGSFYLTFRHHDTFDENSVVIDEVVVEAAQVASVDDNILATTVSIYPTAVDADLTINNTSSIALNSASIIDVNGRLIAKHNLNGLVGEATINVSNLSSGLYFVELSSDNGRAVKKLIKR